LASGHGPPLLPLATARPITMDAKPLWNHRGDKITSHPPQATFTRVSLKPQNMEQCVFVTFPENGWGIKWRIYRKYMGMTNQKTHQEMR